MSKTNGSISNGTPESKMVTITQGRGFLILAGDKGSLTVHRGQCQGEEEQRFFDSFQSTVPQKRLVMSGADRLRFATIGKRPVPASALTPSEWTPSPLVPVAPPTVEDETEKARKASNKRAERGVQARAKTDETGTHLSRLSNACDTLEGQDLYIFWYYIPAELSETEVDNPSDMLWRYGFRFDGSCWIMPEKGMKSEYVQGLLSYWKTVPPVEVKGKGLVGVRTHLTRVHPEDMADMVAMAKDQLATEIRRVHASVINRIAKAGTTLEKAIAECETEQNRRVKAKAEDKAQSVRDNAVRAILKKASESMLNCVACAQAFDETENAKDLLAALRQVIVVETETFNAQMRVRGGKFAPKVPSLGI